MIKNIKLKFGRAVGIPADQIQTAPITVFVGPNNSGKSRVLHELHVYCSNGQRNMANLILEQIEFEPLSHQKAEERIQRVTLAPNFGEALQPSHIIVGKKGTRHHLPQQQLIGALENPNGNPPVFCSWYLSYNILKLDGHNRISLVNAQSAG